MSRLNCAIGVSLLAAVGMPMGCATAPVSQPSIDKSLDKSGTSNPEMFLSPTAIEFTPPKDLPSLDIQLPESSLGPLTGDVLEAALGKSSGKAFIGFKEAASPHIHESARTEFAEIPLKARSRFASLREVRRGTRRPVNGGTIQRALQDLQSLGVKILDYYDNLGIAYVSLPAGTGVAASASPLVDWIDPDIDQAQSFAVGVASRLPAAFRLFDIFAPHWGIEMI